MKNKTINSEKYYPITEIIYLLTEKDLKYLRFAQENHFDEKEFYQFFSSFEHLEKEILKHFFKIFRTFSRNRRL